MKNFLSKLWSLSRTDRVRTLAIDAVSLPSFCRVNMLKLVSVLVLVLTIGVGQMWGASVTWTQVAWGNITTSDVFIITITNSSGDTYLMTSANGTSATPKLGNTGTLNGAKTQCTFNEIDAVKWKKDASNRLCMATDATKWIYTGTSNNALRVGTSTSGNTWSLDGDYIKSNQNRYLSLYRTTDFRSYTSKQSGQVTRFYKASSAPSYTITAQSNNNSYGTVSLSGSVITGSPNSGYQYASPAYSVSPANSATVSQVGNEFTVTPSANTTVTINFEAKPSASISFVNAGTPAPTTSGYYVGDSYTLPSTNNYSCNGKTFVGWSTVPVAETDTKPTSNFYEPGASATLTASQTFYAVFASVTEGTGDWEQCTSSTIADGDYLIVQSDYMMTNTLNSQRFNKTYIAISAGVISYDAKADWSAYTWHIAETSTSGIFTIKNGNNYVIGTGTASKIDLVSTPADDKELFAITYQSTPGTYKIESKYNEAASVNRWLRNGGSYFACYADGGYPYLFKRGSGYGNYCTTCAVTHTVSSAVDPAGKATVTLGATTVAEDATTTAEYSGITTGYEFVNWSISGTGASLSSTTSNPTTITMGTANVTVTANLRCITPSISVQPASKTDYIVGDVATALSVTVNAGGASLSYQWQVSNNNSDWSNIAAGDGGTAATYTPSTAAAGTKYYRVKVTNAATGCSTNATSNAATITVTAASGYCISVYNSSNNGIQSGFSNGGSGNEYTLAFTVPGKDGSSNWPMFWIGENNSSQSYSNNDYLANMHFTHSNATLGLAEGATGTLHIWDNNKEAGSNLWVKFEPDGYGLRWGGADWSQAENTKAFTVDPGDANVWWTDLVTLDGTNNTTWNYYVGLKTASGYVYSGVDNEATDDRGVSRTRAVTTMKVSNGTAGSYKATYLNSEATGTRGKFRIWDNNITDYNFVCHFVPYYRVTYNGSGASGSTDPSADVSCEGDDAARTVVAAANGFTVPTGKSFGGWASSPENAAAGVVAYAAGANVVLTSSITLYAIWTDINYTVTVNQSPDVSATTTGQTSSAHYNGTINLTVTDIPSGYRFVNWTTSDGFSITNPTSATTASFTMPNKNVTVTANFQQTHTVDWYVGGSAVGNKLGDDGQTTVVDHGGKISDFPAHDPDGSACDKTFVGWTNTSSYVHGTSPLFNDVAGSPTINADASFYAVFATGGSGEIFSEDFASFTSGSISSPSSSAESSLDGFDNITYVYQAGEVAKLGTGSYPGSLTTDELTIAAGSSVTISFEVFGWTSVEGDIIVSCDNSGFSDQTVTYTATRDQSMESKSVTVTCTVANPKITIATSTKRAYIDNISISASSYTGHTINCADCGSSVTPTYTAAPAGGTVSVTKSTTPVTSGSTVKTCTAVDLTVTITPATHYTLTGFTATGLTTGTATISPAVNTVVPTTSAQTFTVTVSAGATGTLNLTPTFTAQTPLTITLSTNSKGSFTAPTEFPIYAGETFTFPDVTPNDPTCATFVGWIAGTTFVGDGTTHDAPATIAASTVSDPQNSNATYTAVFYETETSESDAYVKVTSTPANWANDHYLIVYEDAGNSYTNAVAFAGSRDNGDNGNIDATSNGIAVTIVGGNTIAATSSLAANEWRIAAVTGGYSIQSASGYYIGRAANSNGIDASNSTAYVNTIGYSDSRTNITSAGGKILKYNTAGDQLRFRYLTSAGDIQLYKLGTAVVETRTYTTNPSCTPKYRVTVASVTGGSPSADPKFNPESTTVTITANPSAGYSFTSWTITKTTGGDNVTSTLLTGDKPTTANTTFTMPAYDITIAATYAKKMVTELKVMDDETVVANTTGPVSGTLNVSTGANKTLDVVITPSDAFDHSWTASVTAGGTYASITNVTAEGFRVNGLAQGDATITVTASNDEANGGTPKVVTFTVHVTDILPEEIILKREGSDTPIETLIMYYDASESKGQYVKVNVGYSPANPTNKAFTFSSALTGKVGSHSHAPASGYEVLVANGVTSDAVNCTFTSSADGSVTKVLAVTVLPILEDRFVDYVHGNATQTVSARLSVDRYTMITDINTPSLSDASDADPTSEDCETAHYHLVGWLPQATAEALMAAGTPITEATEGLVRAGDAVEATGQIWCAIWAKEQ